ncbi:hypothetical protein CEXT_146001 [Caerostris extrusa]|uniref:Uncharacterized protein n=1 Tax=Caerostris extrusa TaxID=172846 RepID=A0AAV4PAV4_CAEEX|nr:hypothetical protein CEXT_146001 [Caerostris extrusa]
MKTALMRKGEEKEDGGCGGGHRIPTAPRGDAYENHLPLYRDKIPFPPFKNDKLSRPGLHFSAPARDKAPPRKLLYNSSLKDKRLHGNFLSLMEFYGLMARICALAASHPLRQAISTQPLGITLINHVWWGGRPCVFEDILAAPDVYGWLSSSPLRRIRPGLPIILHSRYIFGSFSLGIMAGWGIFLFAN